MTDKYISVAEAAQRIGVHPNTIRNMTDDGRMPCRYLPGSRFRRIPESAIVRIEKRREINEMIYPGPAQTLAEKIADRLAHEAGVFVITKGERAMRLVDAHELIGMVKDYLADAASALPQKHHDRYGLNRAVEILRSEMT